MYEFVVEYGSEKQGHLEHLINHYRKRHSRYQKDKSMHTALSPTKREAENTVIDRLNKGSEVFRSSNLESRLISRKTVFVSMYIALSRTKSMDLPVSTGQLVEC